MIKGTSKICLLGLCAVVALSASSVMAENTDADRIKALEQRIAELESKQDYRIQFAREDAKALLAEIGEDAAQHGGVPSWLDGLKFKGDLRLRYEGQCYGFDTDPGRKDRNRLRFRLRFGFYKTFLDGQMEVGFRLATGTPDDDFGDDSEPTSTNQTMTHWFAAKSIWVDQAYAKWTPEMDMLKGLEVVAGKMPNPLYHTGLIWDSDLNPEGIWAQYSREFGPVTVMGGAGFFFVQEESGNSNATSDRPSDHDVTLMAYKLGMAWKVTDGVKVEVEATYYDFDDLEKNFPAAGGNYDNQVATRYDGVTGIDEMMFGDYNLLNIYAAVGFELMNLPMKVYFDWVHNFSDENIDNTTVWDDQQDGIFTGIKVGKAKKAGSWEAKLAYFYVEPNATVGAFRDGDTGSANTHGFVVGGKYQITDFMQAGLTVVYRHPQEPRANQDDETTVVQVDLIWKF